MTALAATRADTPFGVRTFRFGGPLLLVAGDGPTERDRAVLDGDADLSLSGRRVPPKLGQDVLLQLLVAALVIDDPPVTADRVEDEMKFDERSEYVTRDTILRLLSDDEVARVSSAQTATHLVDGDTLAHELSRFLAFRRSTVRPSSAR